MVFYLSIDLNICILTGRVLKKPRQVLLASDTTILYTEINFLHYKNYFADIFINARGSAAQDIVEFYTIGDYVVVEGQILTVFDVFINSKEQMYVSDIQPAYI